MRFTVTDNQSNTYVSLTVDGDEAAYTDAGAFEVLILIRPVDGRTSMVEEYQIQATDSQT